jgi:hypothetical protein
VDSFLHKQIQYKKAKEMLLKHFAEIAVQSMARKICCKVPILVDNAFIIPPLTISYISLLF